MPEEKKPSTNDLLKLFVEAGVFRENMTTEEIAKAAEKLVLAGFATPSQMWCDDGKYCFILK